LTNLHVTPAKAGVCLSSAAKKRRIPD